jgi:hypothetical protein
MELSDKEYVESCRNGTADDYRELVQRYQKPLFAYLSSRLGNPGEAEEVAQESFVRVSPDASSRNNSDDICGGNATARLPRHWRRKTPAHRRNTRSKEPLPPCPKPIAR